MREPHDLALLLPPMTDDEYQRLREDIDANGLVDAITEYQGKTLDGIHRERICDELGVKPRYEKFQGTIEEATRFVVSKNIARRHLTVSQKADLALKLLPHFEAEGTPGARTDLVPDPVRGPRDRAVKRAADVVGLGKTTVSTAKRVKKHDPDLWKDVVAGKTSVDAADRKMRKRNGKPPAPKHRAPRTESWNGKTNPKRQRELRERRNGDYAELVRTQLRINELCSALEATKLEDFELEDATLAVVADVHDDLITLAEWVDRKLHYVGAWLQDSQVRDKIRRLRETQGRTAEEADTANKLADRLERKLEARLSA